MAERTAFVYGNVLPRFPLESLEKTLRLAGLSITHPSTHLVALLDDYGDRFSLSMNDFRMLLDQNRCASFQWWLAHDHDVYCRIREVERFSVVELGMEGCCPGEIQSILGALKSQLGLSSENSVGLVFDSQGVTEDYDWDRFFVHAERLGANPFLRGFPELLGVKLSDLERVDYLPSNVLAIGKGNWVIFSVGVATQAD